MSLLKITEKRPAGYHSTKGVGRTEPDPATVKEIDGARVNNKPAWWDQCDSYMTCALTSVINCSVAESAVVDLFLETKCLCDSYFIIENLLLLKIIKKFIFLHP